MIEPVVNHIFRLNNDFLEKFQYFCWMPCVNFKEMRTLFVVSCQNVIRLFRIESIQEGGGIISQKNVIFEGFYRSYSEVIYVEFISEYLLFYIDVQNVF